LDRFTLEDGFLIVPAHCRTVTDMHLDGYLVKDDLPRSSSGAPSEAGEIIFVKKEGRMSKWPGAERLTCGDGSAPRVWKGDTTRERNASK
jgi:hypothetical protein